jgi:hypothetical protein
MSKFDKKSFHLIRNSINANYQFFSDLSVDLKELDPELSILFKDIYNKMWEAQVRLAELEGKLNDS